MKIAEILLCLASNFIIWVVGMMLTYNNRNHIIRHINDTIIYYAEIEYSVANNSETILFV